MRLGKFLTVLVFLALFSYKAVAECISMMPYYPIKNNMTWSYQVTEVDKKFTQVVTCQMAPANKREEYDFALKTESVRSTKYYYKISGNWIYLVRIDVKSNMFPIPLTFRVKPWMPSYPVTIDDKTKSVWHWKGKFTSILLSRSIEADFRLENSITIRSAVGSQPGIKLFATYREGKKIDLLESWYSKGIGQVYFSAPEHIKYITEFHG
jgi:hypothetical protein